MSNRRGDRFNGSGYFDPTAYEAIKNISKDQRKSNKKKKRSKKNQKNQRRYNPNVKTDKHND